MNDPLISVTVAAEKIGVNRSTLFRQIKAGAVRSHDGKVKLSEVLEDRAANIDLTRSNRHAGKLDSLDRAADTPVASVHHATGHATRPVAATDEERGETTVIVDGVPVSYSDARALKETYLAKLKQLEFEHKSSELAPLGDMLTYLAREYGVLRERLLTIPGKLASDLSREDVERVTVEIREALEDLHERGAAAELRGSHHRGDDDPEAAPAVEPRRMGRSLPARGAKDERRPG